MNDPTVWAPLNPQKFIRGDGKILWRPIIEKRIGEYVERLALTEIYDGSREGYMKDWRSFDFHNNSQNAVVYRSKSRAERIAGRAAKRRNKAEFMSMEAVPYES